MDGTPGSTPAPDVALVESLCRSWLGGSALRLDRGVAVVLVGQADLETILVATDCVAGRLVELQQALGEGPALSALATRAPVLVGDLAAKDGTRWVGFSREAVAVGARAYWAVPLQFGVIQLGVLAVHATQSGVLDGAAIASLLTLADSVALTLLLPAGRPATGPILSSTRTVVHQACGMVAVQIEASIGEALVALRGHAYGAGRSLDSVARDVVERRLRFRPGGADPEILPAGSGKDHDRGG